MSEPLTESELRQRAVSLLARRDHARRELETKLYRKLGEQAALSAVMAWCEEHGFIDDRRFAGFFVRARIERGVLIHIAAFDWNCPQHITPRYTDADIDRMVEQRLRELGVDPNQQ